MTGAELKAAAEQYIDDTLTDTEAIAAINEGLDWLGEMACIYKNNTITAEAPDTWYALPTDLVHSIAVDDVATGLPYLSYVVRAQEIAFHDAGQYKITYRTTPANITALSDTVAIHQIFKGCLVTKLQAFYRLKDDDGESVDGQRLNQQWQSDAVRAFNSLKRINTDVSTVKVVR